MQKIYCNASTSQNLRGITILQYNWLKKSSKIKKPYNFQIGLQSPSPDYFDTINTHHRVLQRF